MPDTSQGRVTNIDPAMLNPPSQPKSQQPGLLTRAGAAVRYMISGVAPDAWFGPMQPLQPMAPAEVAGRRFDYPQGINLNYNPRSYEGVGFWELRALAENCDILRTVIETRKDQLEALDWTIKIRPDDDDPRADATDDQKARIREITEFFRSPDKRQSWQQWLRCWLEEMFVIDAACFYKRRDKVGRLWGLEAIDGATIKVLIDDTGRTPTSPDPAYQQILHGIPAIDYSTPNEEQLGDEFTRDELLYLVRNPRVHKLTGYSHVQQILLTVNIAIRRSVSQLEFYRAGSVPDGWFMAPKDWNLDQIRDFQKYFDGLMSGNLAELRKVRVVPDGKYEQTKKIDLKDEYDEWLARIICYVFSVPPTPFVKQMNRATAESQHDMALEEGLAPLQKYVANNLNAVITKDFNSPDLIFSWADDREQDPQIQDAIIVNDVKAGLISVDEGREAKGLDPLGGAYAVAMPLLATGYTAPTTPEEQAATAQQQQDISAIAATGKNKQTDPDDVDGSDEESGKETSSADKPQATAEKPPMPAKKILLSKRAVKKKSERLNPYLSTDLLHKRHAHR